MYRSNPMCQIHPAAVGTDWISSFRKLSWSSHLIRRQLSGGVVLHRLCTDHMETKTKGLERHLPWYQKNYLFTCLHISGENSKLLVFQHEHLVHHVVWLYLPLNTNYWFLNKNIKSSIRLIQNSIFPSKDLYLSLKK